MSWARILVPLSGAGVAEAQPARAACAVAAKFGAKVTLAHAPADLAALAPWMGESYLGGLQASAIESLEEAASEGLAAVRATAAGLGYGDLDVISLDSPVWASLAMESRLSDLVVFGPDAARGKGALGEAFQLTVGDEQRPVLVAHPGFDPGGVAAVAWHGGKEASRAVRTALPLLKHAARVVLISAPGASSRSFDPARLRDFLSARGVVSEIHISSGSGDAAHQLLDAARAAGAGLLVAGAFGHPRLQEFIFGGATRTFLAADGPSLFLSH